MITDIWNSYRRMPLWVQIWVGLILVPINLLSIIFWNQDYGEWVAILAVGGMLPNLVFMALDRGFGKSMALSHVVIWTPLCILVIYLLGSVLMLAASGFQPAGMSNSYVLFLFTLLVIDVISLCFDYPDSIKWLKGDRAPA